MERVYKMKKMIVLLLLVMYGCQARQESGDDILQSLLDSDDEPISYYQETEYRWDDGDSFFMKEWRKADGRARTEVYEQGRLQSIMIQTSDGFHVVDYEAEQILVGDNQDSADWLETSLRSPRKWLLDMLQNVYDTYSLGEVKEATYLDRDVFVLELSEENAGGERTELWVDKASWIILKTVSENTEFGYVSEVIHLELEPEIEERNFEIDTSLGFELVPIDSLIPTEPMSLEEAKQVLNGSFLIPNDDYELVELLVYSQDQGDNEQLFDLLYRKSDYSAAFSYSIIKAEELPEAIGFEEEKVTIRGQNGWLMWSETLNMIIFQENGFQYSVFFETGFTKHEAIEMIEKMQEY